MHFVAQLELSPPRGISDLNTLGRRFESYWGHKICPEQAKIVAQLDLSLNTLGRGFPKACLHDESYWIDNACP
jgi:hypothetical protein